MALATKVYEAKKRLAGERDPQFLAAALNLAVFHRSAGRTGKAIEILGPAVELHREIMPSGHPYFEAAENYLKECRAAQEDDTR